MLMGNGVEFMREHIPSNTRIHYIISKGGVAPNVVPDLAQLDLMARNPSNQTLDGIWGRINKIAQGAALMTETTLEVKIVSSDANIIGNDVLAAEMQKNLEFVGGYTMDAKQQEFALALQKTLPEGAAQPLTLTETVQPLKPFDPNAPSASTDVGDISWTVPTIGLSAATFVPGSSAHTWQAAATTGTSIGQDGMVIASKTLAITAVELFKSPELVANAKVEFARQMKGKVYETAIPPGQKPLLDYREN